jgi:nicotinamidase-related amidase
MAESYRYKRLSKDDAVALFVDHQTGLLTLVQDYTPNEFMNSVVGMAETVKFFNLPTVLATSAETGPNGPILPLLKDMFPDAAYVARPGEINAFDNEDFVNAIKATGRKQLLVAGIATEVCVAFVALAAVEAGYDVWVVTDASGTFDEASRNGAWVRMAAAGVQLVNWFAASAELQRDWRNDVEGYGKLLSSRVPVYDALMTYHDAAAKG